MDERILEKIAVANRIVEEVKRKKAELAGRRGELLRRLKEDFDLDSMEELQEYMETLEEESEVKRQELEEKAGLLDDLIELWGEEGG